MKLSERLENILNSHSDMETDSVEKLVYYAYWAGRERATKAVADRYNRILAEQIERAGFCRYHNMALQVQGNIKNLYFDDYAQDYQNTFGYDDTKI